jgi:hypothetical protein
MVGHPDWAGSALVTGADFVSAVNATLAVPANTTKTFQAGFVKPGYFIDLYITVASASSTVPVALVEFIWQDANGLCTIDIEHWYIPATSSGIYRVCGKGPVRGQQLTVNVTNYDPSFAMTMTYTLGENTQHIARDDWRTVDYLTASVPRWGVYTATGTGIAFGDMAAGQIAIQNNDTIGAHTTWSFLLPIYCGPVYWQFNANTAIAVSVRTMTQLASLSTLDGDSPLWFAASMTDANVIIAHPRLPCYVTFSNSTAAGIGLRWNGVIAENCS